MLHPPHLLDYELHLTRTANVPEEARGANHCLVVKVECFAFFSQKGCYYLLSNLCCAFNTTVSHQEISPISETHTASSKFTQSFKWNTSFNLSNKKNVQITWSGVTRLSHDSGDKLVATAGLQPHSFSAQWIVHWCVEVRPNQNQGGNDLIFCSINTFLFGSCAMCHAAEVAIFM